MTGNTSDTEIGFIGLGAMGGPMATRLVEAGHRLTVCDVDAEAVERLVAAGAGKAATPQELASRASLIFVSLPTPAVVESVAQAIAQGSAVRHYVDMSTTGPSTAQRVQRLLGTQGIACLDAPISGGVMGAVNGTLSIMVSGPHESFEVAKPLMAQLSKGLFYLGTEVGQAQVVKLANNLMGASAVIAAIEALAMCSRVGVEPQRALEVFNASTGRSFATEFTVPRAIVSGTYDLGFRMELMHKDVHLCLRESEALGVPMWQGVATGQIFSFAMTQGMAKDDFTAIGRVIAQWAGVSLTAAPAAIA